MPSSDSRVVRGLSIAVLILSILALVACLAGFALLGLTGAMLGNPDVAASLQSQLASDPDFVNELQQYGLTADDALGMSVFGMGLGGFLLAASAIASVITLIASILGMRNYHNPQKLGGAFGFTIAGAILSLLWGNFITMVLMIVLAVFIHRVRNAPAQPVGYGYPGYTYNEPSWSSQVTGAAPQPGAQDPTGAQAPVPPAPQQPGQPR